MIARTLALVLALAGPAAAEVNLTALVGNWRGDGLVSTAADRTPERGRCKLAVTLDDDPAMLIADGLCAVAAGRANIQMRMIDDGRGRVRAGVASPAFDAIAQFAGAGDAAGLTLMSTMPTPIDGALYDLRVEVMFVSDTRFSLVEWIAPAGSTTWRQTIQLDFRRTEP